MSFSRGGRGSSGNERALSRVSSSISNSPIVYRSKMAAPEAAVMARKILWSTSRAACIDYLRHVSPHWHERLQPALWVVLALVAVARALFYRHWPLEIRAAIPFLASMVFMLRVFLFEIDCSFDKLQSQKKIDLDSSTPLSSQ